jgi:AraC-like DNA-binding protein
MLSRQERVLFRGNTTGWYGYGDAQKGGHSDTRLQVHQGNLQALMSLEFGHPTPYTGFGVGFVDSLHPQGVDFSSFEEVEIEMRSSTMRNVGFQIITWADGFPRASGDLPGFYQDLAVPVTASYSRTRIPLRSFAPSSWWPQSAGVEANVVPIRMDLVKHFEIRVPIGAQPIRHDTIEIRSLKLVGRNWLPLLLAMIVALGLSLGATLRLRRRMQPAESDAVTPAQPSDAIPKFEVAQVALPNRSDLELQALLQWIGQNYHQESILVEEAARGSGLPARRIPQLLKEHCGKSFPAYVASLRIVQACRLLRETDRQVSEIALAVGFSNPGHFHRVFKAETGDSPSSWRDLHGKPSQEPAPD